MLMMTGGGESGSMAPVMMTGGGESGSMAPVMMTGDSLEYKNPATEPKWKGKTLYLTFRGNTSIRAIKVFEDRYNNLGETRVPEPVCKLDMHNDCALPVGMGLFKLNKKVYFVGGETTSLKDPFITDRFMRGEASKFFQSSDKVYEFDPSDLPNNNTCFREIPDYCLPIPTPQPIVANIRGKVYVLSGDHISGKPGCPEKPEVSFQVMEFNPLSKSYHWKTLPLPHSYIEDYTVFGHRTLNIGVIGHRLFIAQHPMGRGKLLHIFDAHTQSWESREDGFWLFPPPAMTLSSLLTSSGPYHKKTKISDIGQGKKDSYFIVLGTECHFDRYDRVFAAVVDFDGVMSHLQYLRDPLPAGFRPLGDCKVIDLLEEDEQDDDGHLSSSIFCVVYISCDSDQLALSVFRVSLLSPMAVVTPTDEPPYLSRQDKGEEEASVDESRGGDSLHVEILEKRIYALGDAYPDELSDAFFL